MPHLLESWQQISARLQKAEAIALFLDFDGTLVDIRARPEEVWLHPATRRVLLRLVRRRRVRVWVISGRRLADVRDRIRVPGVRYFGLHGWEGNGNGKLSESTLSFLRQAMGLLAPRIEGAPGLSMEDKGSAFAVHYRGASDIAITEARAALLSVLEPFGGRLRMIEGDHILEVLPREFRGKGVAARREWLTLRRAVPIYVGNDASDESAFAALAPGVTVRVGRSRNSRAHFRLGSPAEVRLFLEKLEAEVA